MSVKNILSDEDIDALIAEPKALPVNYAKRLELRANDGYERSSLDIDGANGGEFTVSMRRNRIDPSDFSVILTYRMKTSTQKVNLRRYNGPHEHTNKIEKEGFNDFHIHMATERYQQRNAKAEHYAVKTSRYKDVFGALECMLDDCNFERPESDQGDLFK